MLKEIEVRRVQRAEEGRYQALMQAHHYLGALGMKSGTTLSQGWARGWFDGCVATTSYQSEAAFLHAFQCLRACE